ncbi:hypothetical protein I316_04970 [Kwoniella heveanensis BCC8398]|uniref:Cryptic loci regulator 2 N-terminal domain-containing protein n=1 Tax=Kwoniella heveanensis BCC8398 TaxID=1296120 RepID=A0A1B9GQ57_9TREE|nr:hypothetical protein I316_04970 [Kwoniella heveanensis BCC8398]
MSAPSHPALVWPRSDKDTSRYPEISAPRDDDWYYEEVPLSDPKYKLYEAKTAEFICQKLGLKVDASKQRMPMPPGYKLFAHRKKQPAGDIRTDFYLYGSTHVQKFRSVPEFLEHAGWLFDTTKPLDDHTTCGCKYSKGSGARRVSTPGSGAGPSKRPSNSSPAKEGSVKKKKIVQEEEDDGPAAVVPERAEELRSQRRFRRGEIVWFRIGNIDPPSGSAGNKLSPITHWPGLISSVPLKSKVLNQDDIAGASASSAWNMFGGQAPAPLQQPTIIHYYEYHIRPLGMFSPHDEVVKDGKELLPWAVGNELLGGEDGWDAIGNQAEALLIKGVKAEAEKNKNKPKEELEADLGKSWKTNWAKRIKFLDMPRQWESAVFRLSVALKTASIITNSWAQTDKIDVLPDDIDISVEDMKAIQEQRKTLYQGLWWGGERIWLEDMVRLKKKRTDLPSDSLLPPSPGAEDRGVFIKIRVISIEVSFEATETQNAWRCILYGDVYELAPEGTDGAEKPRSNKALNGEKDIPIMPAYTPAKGFGYRQLNDPGAEVTCDVIDIAGRVYPDLLDGKTQSWFIDPSKPEDKEKRVTPGEAALSLVGLKPGTTIASKSVDWHEDLYSIVQKSSRDTEAQMKAYYINLLRQELDLPAPAPTSTGGAANGAGTLAEALNGSA